MTEEVLSMKGLTKVTFSETLEDGEIIIRGSIPMNGYVAMIVGTVFDGSLCAIENAIRFPDSDVEFYFTDVFDLLDIEDFCDYSYFGAYEEDKDEEISSIEEIADAFLKYDYEIKRLAEGENHRKLEKLRKEKEKESEVSGSLIGDLRIIFKSDSLLRKYKQNPNEKTKSRLIKYLEKIDSKGKLSVGDRRLLRKLKSEKTINLTLSKYEKDENYSRIRRKFFLYSFLIIFVICYVVYFSVLIFLMKDSVNSITAPYFFIPIAHSLLLTLSVCTLSERKIVKKYIEKKGIEAEQITKKTTKRDEAIQQFIIKYVAPVFFLVLTIYSVYVSFSVNSMKQDKFVYYSFSGKQVYEYSELEAYKVLGSYSNGEYFENDVPDICFLSNDETLYTVMTTNEKNLEKIEQFLEEKNVELKVVKAKDDIS